MDQPSSLQSAAARCDFRLTYGATAESRRLHGFGIESPDIPNAYWHMQGDGDGRSTTSPGDWEDPGHPRDEAPEQEHIHRWFNSAVSEAVHEALEWFYVDGQPFLDPHGVHQNAINRLSEDFAARLAELAASIRVEALNGELA